MLIQGFATLMAVSHNKNLNVTASRTNLPVKVMRLNLRIHEILSHYLLVLNTSKK